MKDGELRREMGMAGRLAMRAYRPDVVWNSWEALLQKAVNGEK